MYHAKIFLSFTISVKSLEELKLLKLLPRMHYLGEAMGDDIIFLDNDKRNLIKCSVSNFIKEKY